jgi:hypothetical protein
MLNALAWAVEHPPAEMRIMTVADIALHAATTTAQ